MTYKEVMTELRGLGTEQTKKIYINHGADTDLYGVSIANLKKIAKKNKNDHDLGYKLLYSNNVDAMYLSQWIVNPQLLKINDYEKILESTNYYMIIENVIAPLVARNYDLSFTCLHKWIDSSKHRERQVAYTILSIMLGSYDNDLLDMDFILNRLDYVENNIQEEENRVKYAMNNFVMAVGISLPSFTKKAIEASIKAGKVNVDMGETSCNVPVAHKYIKRAKSMNKIGIKRKL